MELEQIGKYRILGKLGQGAMGEVYKAHDPILLRDVAVKTISASLAADSDLRKRFYREAQSAARLNHPNIITVYDFGEEQGKIYMAMELLEGTDLKEVIARRAITRVEDKLTIFEQICDGLAFAHAKEIVHRDLKPSNIHIQPNGQVKVMDFGLARLGSSEMTRAGTIMGTPHYMSPEQVRGERADARSDIFSLGAVFYELLTYHKAFEADSMHSILFQVLEKEPQSARSWVPDLPPMMVEIVDKALAKDPAHRFANASEMREALRHFRESLAAGTSESASLPSVLSVRVPDRTIHSDPTLLGLESPRTQVSSSDVTRVQGALARDVAPVREGSQPRTLSGRAPTHVDPSLRRPPPERASRLPRLALGGALVLIAAGAGFWALGRRQPAPVPPPDAATQQVGALTQALIGTQLELASRNLDDKDYRGAIAQAERALALDARNAEAQQIRARAQAILDELDVAAAEARGAFDKGDTAAASRALSKVLAIDPSHPVATQLSKNLNSVFRGQAEDARRDMGRSRTAAEKLNGDSLPPFVEAGGLVREADALLRRSEFVAATQKYLQARDGFDRAARMAERQLARPAAPPVAPSAAQTTAPPTAVAVLPPPSLPPATVPATTPPPPTAVPPPPPAVVEEPAIRRVLAEYGNAIERKDLGLFKAVKPNLSADEERRLRDAFKAVKSQQVAITIGSIRVDGGKATVRVSRQDTIDGRALRPVEQTFTLVKGPSGWAIEGIGQ